MGMQIVKSEARRFLTMGRIAILLTGVVLPVATLAQPDFVRDGEAGFVVTYIAYALSRDCLLYTSPSPRDLNPTLVFPIVL